MIQILIMSNRDFLEYVKNDLNGISGDILGFLEVYYPMLKATWNPSSETDFILGWLLGNKEQEYSNHFYEKTGQRIYHELLFEIQREIKNHKDKIIETVENHLNKTESK